MKYLGKTMIMMAAVALFTACGGSASTENSDAEANTSAEEQSAETNTETSDEPMAASGLVNPNLASEADLTNAGLSAELAAQIIEQRPFLTMTALDTELAKTLDEPAREALYAKLFVPMNLNDTPEDDFKIIPGVGDRMAHEFEEYRPYSKLAQFQKEIGKYVDEAEVARLQQYIFVPVELNTASEEDILALPGVGKRMAHEFEEYRPYVNMEQFRKEISKYVDDKELSRLERFVYLNPAE
ncbi:MAG TPA: hypothetical protein DCE41_00675 [Cytophagales bacterium]|nr:hypothetical protein [Cytophagales bacterium]HAA23592.1 hypothetical protein [Cytophagales bacterium]HAP60730.1 hypothetical protein [Cytophagales bacterium]